MPEVRVIDEKEGQVGVLAIAEAMALAKKRNLDLVEVSPLAEPPVCKLLNWGRYKYQLQRKQTKQKAKTRKVEIKGIRLSFKISEHDKLVRKKQAEKFLEKGDKIRVELILRGREHAHRDIAERVVQEFVESVDCKLKIEQPIKQQGHIISIVAGRA